MEIDCTTCGRIKNEQADTCMNPECPVEPLVLTWPRIWKTREEIEAMYPRRNPSPPDKE